MNGKYVTSCRVEEESDLVVSKEGADAERRLWDETIEILQRADGRVRGIVEKYLVG